MAGQHFTEPAAVNDAGTRLVLETNWGTLDGPRCQMIWQAQPDGGCVITTCMKGMDPIRLTGEQVTTLAYWLRQVPR